MNYTVKTRTELKTLLENEILNAAGAAEYIGCSRQYVDKLVRLGKLVPIKEFERYRLYFKSDLEVFKQKGSIE